jgi:hypothetical protein
MNTPNFCSIPPLLHVEEEEEEEEVTVVKAHGVHP